MHSVPAELQVVIDKLDALPEREKRVQAFNFVRNIAYGSIGSRDPFEVLRSHKGTCSGKHALLRILFKELGYETQSWFALHDFSKFPIARWPAELEHFQRHPIPDYHDFVKMQIGDAWVTVDAVFDSPLKALGFPVDDWDGETDMSLPIQASEIFLAEEPVEEHKKRLIGALPESAQKDRKEFLQSMTAWLDKNR